MNITRNFSQITTTLTPDNDTQVNRTQPVHTGDHEHEEKPFGFFQPHGKFILHIENRGIFFLFTIFAIGVIAKRIKSGLPYTVVMTLVGMMLVLITVVIPGLEDFWSPLSDIDPHLILLLFLPCLIFESALSLDYHAFMTCKFRICLYALVGCVFSFVITGGMIYYILRQAFSFSGCLLLSSIVTATDPVAVVALLRELGVDPKLAVTLEGESLLNDGVVIVCFGILKSIYLGLDLNGGYAFLDVLFTLFGGIFLGYVTGRIEVKLLTDMFNDPLSELTVTLATPYILYWICESFSISGVIACVILGLVMNNNKTCISPKVEHFAKEFWELLAYFANTMIFTLLGMLVIKNFLEKKPEVAQYFQMLLTVIMCLVSRTLMFVVFELMCSLWKKNMNWKDIVVCIWGGLRGAVSLSLALSIYKNENFGDLRDIILLHTSAVVLLTVSFNAITMERLLIGLGYQAVPPTKILSMNNAVAHLRQTRDKMVANLKRDRFLANANWSIVEEYCRLHSPYRVKRQPTVSKLFKSYNVRTENTAELEKNFIQENNNNLNKSNNKVEEKEVGVKSDSPLTYYPLREQYSYLEKHLRMFPSIKPREEEQDLKYNEAVDSLLPKKGACPGCNAPCPTQLSNATIEAMLAETRSRVIHSEEISIWNQYHDGRISAKTAKQLLELLNTIKDRKYEWPNLESIRKRGWFHKFTYHIAVRINKFLQSLLPKNSIVRIINKRLKSIEYKDKRFRNTIILHETTLHDLKMIDSVDKLKSKILQSNLLRQIDETSVVGYAVCFMLSERELFNYVRRFFELLIVKGRITWLMFVFCIFDMIALTILIRPVHADEGLLIAIAEGFDYFYMTCLVFEHFIKTTYFFPKLYYSNWPNVVNTFILFLAMLYCMLVLSCIYYPDLNCKAIFHTSHMEVILYLQFFRAFRLIELIIIYVYNSTERSIYEETLLQFEKSKSFIIAQEAVLESLDQIIPAYEDVGYLGSFVENNCSNVMANEMKQLGIIQQNRTEICISIKTSIAIDEILSFLDRTLNDLKKKGMISVEEAEKIEKIVEKKKYSVRIPTALPFPSVHNILVNSMPWLEEHGEIVDFLADMVQGMSYNIGELIYKKKDPTSDFHIVISGVVRETALNDTTMGDIYTPSNIPNSSSPSGLVQNSVSEIRERPKSKQFMSFFKLTNKNTNNTLTYDPIERPIRKTRIQFNTSREESFDEDSEDKKNILEETTWDIINPSECETTMFTEGEVLGMKDCLNMITMMKLDDDSEKNSYGEYESQSFNDVEIDENNEVKETKTQVKNVEFKEKNDEVKEIKEELKKTEEEIKEDEKKESTGTDKKTEFSTLPFYSPSQSIIQLQPLEQSTPITPKDKEKNAKALSNKPSLQELNIVGPIKTKTLLNPPRARNSIYSPVINYDQVKDASAEWQHVEYLRTTNAICDTAVQTIKIPVKAIIATIMEFDDEVGFEQKLWLRLAHDYAFQLLSDNYEPDDFSLLIKESPLLHEEYCCPDCELPKTHHDLAVIQGTIRGKKGKLQFNGPTIIPGTIAQNDTLTVYRTPVKCLILKLSSKLRLLKNSVAMDVANRFTAKEQHKFHESLRNRKNEFVDTDDLDEDDDEKWLSTAIKYPIISPYEPFDSDDDEDNFNNKIYKIISSKNAMFIFAIPIIILVLSGLIFFLIFQKNLHPSKQFQNATIAQLDKRNDCYNEYGYNGTVNVTENNIVCQAWNKQNPHRHSLSFLFGDKDGNNCRLIPTYLLNGTIITKHNRPWCFTMSTRHRWNYCAVNRC
ncbi:hypothetical protein SNEBB_004258 [Seison nebaliae]|nr:hypothetical protein SNEBB_004258 [Seison nebaliae]